MGELLRLERSSTMSAEISLAEMKQQYHNEWLLIAYTQVDENWNVLRGEVLAHSPDVQALYALLPNYRDRSVAFQYIGEIPDDIAIVL